MKAYEVAVQIDVNHPALAGHFPGNPIVPAVVILNEVALATAALEAAPISVRAVKTAKFLSPLPPGQQFTVQLTKVDQGRVHFVCKEPRNLIAAGEIEYCLRS